MFDGIADQTVTQVAPLSPFQEIWLVDQQENDGPLQATFATFQLDGPLNIELTERVLDEIWRRHEMLRTIIPNKDNRTRLWIATDGRPALSIVNLDGLARSERDAAVEWHLNEAAACQHGLMANQTAQVKLVRLDRNLHLLLLTASPIVCDAISTQLFGAEFAQLYEAFAGNNPAMLPEHRLQYRDFVRLHRRWLRNGAGGSDIAYWQTELAGLSRRFRNFGDQALSGHSQVTAGTEKIIIPASLYEDLRCLADKHSVDLETTLLAVFQVLLHRYSGDDEVSVGVVVAGRQRHEVQGLIGCLVNHLVLRMQFPAGLTFAELLSQISACRKRAAEHSLLSLQTVLEKCLASGEGDQRRFTANHRNLFRAVFSMQEAPLPRRSFSDLVLTQLDVDEPIVSCDLAMSVVPDGGNRLTAKLVYNHTVFSANFAGCISRHFINLLTAAIENPHLPVERLPLMDTAEHLQVTAGWNDTDVSFRRDVCLHELVETQVKRTPLACAIVYQDQQLSYQELDRRANQLARYLRQFDIKPDTKVSICLEPSIELMVAILAVLKAGGAYNPISPSTPKQRVQFLLEDTGAPVLITKSRFLEDNAQFPCHVILLDAHAADIARQRAEPISNAALPDNLAYIIYTSGSTGKPKGVMVPHRGICNTLQWRQATFPFNLTDRVLLTLSFTFDASIFQLFQPLLAGACLVIPAVELGGDPTRIIQAVRRHRITVLGLPTSLWRLLLGEPDFEQCDSVRIAFCGGESLSADIPEKINTRLGIELHNMYGPTEASMEATCWTCTPATPVSIGRPIANVRAYVFDEQLQLAPVGVAGELYLGGAGLARGYLNNPALTAERFQSDPFDSTAGARMYRTGDVCRWLPNGCLEYVGRRDHQVKLNGHRIELEEIEAVLQSHAAVRESVVVLREDRSGDKRLVGYVVSARTRETRPEELRRYLGSRLPPYMIPSMFVFLESLPRTITGKPDRRALPAPRLTLSSRPFQDWSGRPLERFLAGLWEEVLGVHGVGDHDNFFELGGNSIHVAILTRKLEETLKEFVYTVALYDAPTIDELAYYLRLNYPQSVVRLFGQEALDGVAPARGSAVDQASIDTLRSLIRIIPERVSGSVEPKNPPAVFVLSPPRSGSTLFRVMLGGHPALFAPPELQLLNYNTLRERKAALSSERDSFWLQGLIRALMEIRRCEADEATRIMEEFEQRDLSVKECYRLMQDWLGDVMFVDKTPVYSLDLQTLKRAEEDFENARYIHLIRHPSPMIASFEEAKLHVFFPPFFTGPHHFTTWQLAELMWDICHQNIHEFLRTIPSERSHVVRFEELVHNPQKTMEGVADFLGLPFHPNMINPYQQDRRAQMTDAIHPMARMLGDVKFHRHGKIKAEAAQRRQGRYPEEALGEVTRQLARTFGYELRNRQCTTVVGLETRGGSPAFFCVHPAGGTVSCYRDLVRQLGPNQPFYVFRAPTLDGTVPSHTSVQELASSYVRELRDFQPHGPYQLGGWSFGGLVAFEMALQLAASGQEIALLALFSSYLTQSGFALLPLRPRDFALEFLGEHGLDVPPAGSGGFSRRELLRRAFDQAKQTGGVSQELGFDDFRRVMVQHRRTYLAHVRIGRRYVPHAQVERIILFEAEDRSLDGRGPFVDWDTVAAQVSRHLVPGNHFTMVREPNVRHLADCLRQYLAVSDYKERDQ